MNADHTPGTVAVFRVPDPAPIHPDGGQGRLMGVIAAVHQHDDKTWVNLVAAHSTPEMATDHDVVVNGSTPYPLVLMGECYAQAWAAQIVAVVGRVPFEAVQAAWRSVCDDGESAEVWNAGHAGQPMPLAGSADPRWSWVAGWLPTLTALSSPVRAVLLDGEDDAQADRPESNHA